MNECALTIKYNSVRDKHPTEDLSTASHEQAGSVLSTARYPRFHIIFVAPCVRPKLR